MSRLDGVEPPAWISTACDACHHPANDHGDRAVTPCARWAQSVDWPHHAVRCPCRGYRHTPLGG